MERGVAPHIIGGPVVSVDHFLQWGQPCAEAQEEQPLQPPPQLPPQEHLPSRLSFTMLMTARVTAATMTAITSKFPQFAANQSNMSVCLSSRPYYEIYEACQYDYTKDESNGIYRAGEQEAKLVNDQ